MLQKGAPEEEISKTLQMFGEKYSDYGSTRTKSVVYHIDEIERLLLPTQVTKMCMWSLHQDDDFFKVFFYFFIFFNFMFFSFFSFFYFLLSFFNVLLSSSLFFYYLLLFYRKKLMIK